MYDRALVAELLLQVAESLQTVQDRFESISSPSGFLDTPAGRERMDAICMQLLAVGEAIKAVDRITHGTLLPQYPDTDWKGAMGLRDILAHHYFDIDAEQVFWICSQHVPQLAAVLAKLRDDHRFS